jgi:hypothetical protein
MIDRNHAYVRIGYYIYRRTLRSMMWILLTVCGVSLVLGSIMGSLILSDKLFGTVLYGFLPLSIFGIAGCCYPLASTDYKKELAMQEETERKLKYESNRRYHL